MRGLGISTDWLVRRCVTAATQRFWQSNRPPPDNWAARDQVHCPIGAAGSRAGSFRTEHDAVRTTRAGTSNGSQVRTSRCNFRRDAILVNQYKHRLDFHRTRSRTLTLRKIGTLGFGRALWLAHWRRVSITPTRQVSASAGCGAYENSQASD